MPNLNYPLIILIIGLVYLAAKRADIVARIAHFHYARGNTQKSINTFAFANKFGNMNANNKIVYGYLLLRVGEINTAAKVLNLVILQAKKPPVANRAKAMLALTTWKRGDLDDAIESLESLIESYRTTNVYQNLGLMYVLKGEPKRALEFNLEAAEFNDSDKIILDNLAEAYLLNGEREKAKEVYEKLFTLSPHFPEAFFGYGKLLVELGETERGVELIREALDKPFTFLSVLTREKVERYLEWAEGQ